MSALGTDTRNVTANIPDRLYEQLKKLADQSGIGISTYISKVLIAAADRGLVIESKGHLALRETSSTSAGAAVESAFGNIVLYEVKKAASQTSKAKPRKKGAKPAGNVASGSNAAPNK